MLANIFGLLNLFSAIGVDFVILCILKPFHQLRRTVFVSVDLGWKVSVQTEFVILFFFLENVQVVFHHQERIVAIKFPKEFVLRFT